MINLPEDTKGCKFCDTKIGRGDVFKKRFIIIKNKKEGAKKTIFLLENKKKSKEIGKRGKESVQKQYLLTKLLKNHLLLYLELLD